MTLPIIETTLGRLAEITEPADVLTAVYTLEVIFAGIPLSAFDQFENAQSAWQPRKCAALAVGYLIEKCGNPIWKEHRMFILHTFGDATDFELLLGGFAIAHWLKGVEPQSFQLIDADARHLEDPERFQVPDSADLDALKPGDLVKIGVEWEDKVQMPADTGPFAGGWTGGERFWVIVVTVDPDGGFTGTISNKLVHSAVHGLDDGMPIEFERRHILTTNVPPPAEPIIVGVPADESERRVLGIVSYEPPADAVLTECKICTLRIYIGPRQHAHTLEHPEHIVCCPICMMMFKPGPSNIDDLGGDGGKYQMDSGQSYPPEFGQRN